MCEVSAPGRVVKLQCPSCGMRFEFRLRESSHAPVFRSIPNVARTLLWLALPLEYVKKVLTRSTPETLGMARERRRSRRSRGLYHLCVGKIIGLSRVSGLRINVGGVVWEI